MHKKKRKMPSRNVKRCGLLLVVTGRSGAGKDTIAEGVLSHSGFSQYGFKRLITCADRCPRENEVHGVHYYFIRHEEMEIKKKNNEFVEEPVLTGTSYKATPRSEFSRIIEEGANLLWRIDPSKAAEVATGKFFDEQFPESAEIFKKITIVCCVTAKTEEIIKRRKIRDCKKYNEYEYSKRDEQEHPHLSILEKHAHLIYNAEGKHEEAVSEIFTLVSSHFSSQESK